MKVLNLAGTEDTPKVILDKDNELFEISGRSLPEDSAEFFAPILKWIEDYAENANSATKFLFKLEYFNTASSKLILDVLSALEEIENTTIVWFYHEDDEDMQEAGEEFEELVELEFEFETY